MLKAFFEKTPKDASCLFKNFKIWAAGEKYRAEQGKYPVIYLTSKDVDERSYSRNLLFLLKGQYIISHPQLDQREGAGMLVDQVELRTTRGAER